MQDTNCKPPTYRLGAALRRLEAAGIEVFESRLGEVGTLEDHRATVFAATGSSAWTWRVHPAFYEDDGLPPHGPACDGPFEAVVSAIRYLDGEDARVWPD